MNLTVAKQEVLVFENDTSNKPNFCIGFPSGYAYDQKASYKNITFKEAIAFIKSNFAKVVSYHKDGLNGMCIHLQNFLSLFSEKDAQCTVYSETHFMSFIPYYLRIGFPLCLIDSSLKGLAILHYKFFDGYVGSYDDEVRYSMFVDISDMERITLSKTNEITLKDNYFSDLGGAEHLKIKPLVFTYYARTDLNHFDFPSKELFWETCREDPSTSNLITKITHLMGCTLSKIDTAETIDPPEGCYIGLQKKC
jgi:hypothetical protein